MFAASDFGNRNVLCGDHPRCSRAVSVSLHVDIMQPSIYGVDSLGKQDLIAAFQFMEIVRPAFFRYRVRPSLLPAGHN